MSTCKYCNEFFDEENESNLGFCGNCGELRYEAAEPLSPEDAEESRLAAATLREQRKAFRLGVLSGIDRGRVTAAMFVDDYLVSDFAQIDEEANLNWQPTKALDVAKKIQSLLRQPQSATGEDWTSEHHQAKMIYVFESSPVRRFPTIEEGGFSDVMPVPVKMLYEDGDEYFIGGTNYYYGFLLTSNQYASDLELCADIGEKLLAGHICSLHKQLERDLKKKHEVDESDLSSFF